MKKSVLFFFLLLSLNLFAQTEYSTYNSFLQKYVSNSGKVNYKKIKSNKGELDAIVKSFQNNSPQKSWSKNAQLAYWLNAYNLFTIKLIVDNYPLKKITDLDNGKTWDVKRIDIAGKKYSLNEIENEIIRPTFKDARIHFALNCAAKSCPPLWNRAFTTATVQSNLESRTKAFIISKNNELAQNIVKVSKIFDWYKVDFGDLIAFLNKYSTVSTSKNVKIEYLEYDWSLNE